MTLSSVIGLELSPNPAWATLPIAMMMLATVLTTLPASLLMKRIGRRMGFVLGATLGGVLGCGLMFWGMAGRSFALFCGGMFLIGIYQSFAMYYRFAAADVTRKQFRSRAISFVMAGGAVAAVLGPLNARASLDLIPAVPMGEPFIVTLIASALAALLLVNLRVPRSELGPHKTDPGRPLRAIAQHRGFPTAILMSSVCFSIMVLYMTVTPLGMQAQGFDMNQITLVIQAQVLSMFLPAFFTGVLINRFGLLPIVWSGIAAMTAAMLIGAVSATIPVYMASRIALGIGWNFMFIGSAVLLTTTHKAAERGTVQGVNDMAMFSLVTLISLTAAALLQHLGWNMLHLASLLPIAAVAGSIMWMTLKPGGREITV